MLYIIPKIEGSGSGGGSFSEITFQQNYTDILDFIDVFNPNEVLSPDQKVVNSYITIRNLSDDNVDYKLVDALTNQEIQNGSVFSHDVAIINIGISIRNLKIKAKGTNFSVEVYILIS